MNILSKKEKVGRTLSTKKDILGAFRELNHAKAFAGAYPKNALGQVRLSKAEADFMSQLSSFLGKEITREHITKAEGAILAFEAKRENGIKIAKDKVLWELLARMEEGNFSLSEYAALDKRLGRYGFMSRRRLERFLGEVNIAI